MEELKDTENSVSVERVIPAPADQIFALIADPVRHHDIDGSGSVREAKDVPAQLQLGSKFGMKMKLGIPYSMVSTVIEFEPNRRIAWQTWPPIGAFMGGGRIWRYELEPVDGGTRVRETWDISQEVGVKPLLRNARTHEHTRKAMEQTLENIEKLLAS